MGMGWMWLWVILGLLGLWALVAFAITWIVGPRRREAAAEVLERQLADGEITSEEYRRLRHLPPTNPTAPDKKAPE